MVPCDFDHFFGYFGFSRIYVSGNPDLWAFLESLGQDGFLGTLTISVGALVEAQLRET